MSDVRFGEVARVGTEVLEGVVREMDAEAGGTWENEVKVGLRMTGGDEDDVGRESVVEGGRDAGGVRTTVGLCANRGTGEKGGCGYKRQDTVEADCRVVE
jgi:hypothetical protein